MRLAVALPSLAPEAPHRIALDRTIQALVAAGVEVECFVESTRLSEVDSVAPTFHYLRMHERHRVVAFDTALYPLGRDYRPYEPAFLLAMQFPGVVWVLDPVLHHLIVGGVVVRGRWDEYARVCEQAFGARGAQLAHTMAAGWAAPAFYRKNDPVPYLFAGQRSRLAASEAIAAAWPDDKLGVVVELPFVDLQTAEASVPRLLIATMNFNRPAPLLGGLRALLEVAPQLQVCAIAPPLVHAHLLAPVAARLGGLGSVQWQGQLDDVTLRRELDLCTVVAFLREDLTVGDNALLQMALAAGKTVLVLGTEHYRCYPDACVMKIDPGYILAQQLASGVATLLRTERLAEAMATQARQFVAGLSTPEQVAGRLRGHLQQSAKAAAGWRDISSSTREAFAEQVGCVALPGGATAAGREFARAALGNALGERWWPSP